MRNGPAGWHFASAPALTNGANRGDRSISLQFIYHYTHWLYHFGIHQHLRQRLHADIGAVHRPLRLAERTKGSIECQNHRPATKRTRRAGENLAFFNFRNFRNLNKRRCESEREREPPIADLCRGSFGLFVSQK